MMKKVAMGVAAAAAMAAAPVEAVPLASRLSSYRFAVSPGGVFQTNWAVETDESASFSATFASGSHCATVGIDWDLGGGLIDSSAYVGTPPAGQTYQTSFWVDYFSLVGSATSGCAGLADTVVAPQDTASVLSQSITVAPGKFGRITFRISEAPPASGGYLVQSPLDGSTFSVYFTTEVEELDSSDCDRAEIPEQCLHPRAVGPESVAIRSLSTGGEVTAESTEKCLTLAILPDDGDDHTARCNYDGIFEGPVPKSLEKKEALKKLGATPLKH